MSEKDRSVWNKQIPGNSDTDLHYLCENTRTGLSSKVLKRCPYLKLARKKKYSFGPNLS